MPRFGDRLVKIAEAYKARDKLEISGPGENRHQHSSDFIDADEVLSGPDTFSKWAIEIGEQIILAVNDDISVQKRNELIKNAKERNAVFRMIEKIMFLKDSGIYALQTRGDGFLEIADQLEKSLKMMGAYLNAARLAADPEIPGTIKAIIEYLREDHFEGKPKINYFARDVAKELIKAWEVTGNKTALTVLEHEDNGEKKKVPITGFGIFVKTTRTILEPFIYVPEENRYSGDMRDFFDLSGLDEAIKIIKAGKIPL